MKAIVTALAAAFLLTGGVASALLPAPAHAQAIGDRKCGPDGRVMTFYGGAWHSSETLCSGRMQDGYAPSRNADNRQQQAPGPIDGDTKCGADGHVLRFDKGGPFTQERWVNTMINC